MEQNLYRDFVLTVDNCDSEPIERPLAIQGHGHVLVFDLSDSVSLHAISDGAENLFNLDKKYIWQTPPSKWLPKLLGEALQSLQNSGASRLLGPLSYTCVSGNYQVLVHLHMGRAFIEFEPAQGFLGISYSRLRDVVEQFRACRASEDLFDRAAQCIKKIISYDRVMIYQFDHDFHGMVVGEAKENHLEPFLGLHYPATDIPPMARKLFLLNRSRAIHDIRQANRWLRFNPTLSAPQPYLDLSMVELRATSPIHIEYLENMGVRASMTLAIVQHGKLWGLVACHHYSPRIISYEDRKLCESLADLLSLRLTEITLEFDAESMAAMLDVERHFLKQINIDDFYKLELLSGGHLLAELCQCDGAAAVTEENKVIVTGVTPNVAAMLALRSWLLENNLPAVYETDNLLATAPVQVDLDENIGGMLAARVSDISNSYLFWFRFPQRQTTTWAGDPRNTALTEAVVEGGHVRISPRKSFEKWQQAVEDKSLPWSKDVLAMAERIRDKMLKKESKHTASLVLRSKNELEQLVFASSHDLQEPIRTQLSSLDLLTEELEQGSIEDCKAYIKRASRAALRMQGLIVDLLEYARLASPSERVAVNLNDLIAEIKEGLESTFDKTKTQLTVVPLPAFIGVRSELKQLFQNLITNAIKYVAPGVEPRVNIDLKRADGFYTFLVKDNGIGIDKRYYNKIFLMFQRLHRKEEYAGSGIGLALCKKIVEKYNGAITLESTEGQGSTFFLKFNAYYFDEGSASEKN